MSQCAEILALLETGPKTTREILREVPCIVHSRVAELRKQGHNIVCETIGVGAAGHRYHLLSSLRAAGPQQGTGHPAARSDTAHRSFSPNGVTERGPSLGGLTTPQREPGPRSADAELQLELDWIDQELDQPIVLGSENAFGRREALRRQRKILERRL